MKELFPILRLFKAQRSYLLLAIFLSICTLLASIGLLSLSGWFISACAVAGLSPITAKAFNYMLPAGAVRGFSIIRTFGRWADRVVSHDATFRILQQLRVHFFKQLTPHFNYIKRHFSHGDLLNRLLSDIEVMDQLFVRLINPLLVGVILILSITLFTCYFDIVIGVLLGGSLLLFLVTLPIIFYRLGKQPSSALAQNQAQYRNHIVDWLDNHSELLLFSKEKSFYTNMQQHEKALYQNQRLLNQINAFSNALLILLNAWLLLIVLWIAADGIGGKQDPLIALIVFTTLASFELLTPVAQAFQYLGQTLISAKRLNEITQKEADITFVSQSQDITQGEIHFKNISFSYPDALAQHPVISDFSLDITAKENVAFVGKTGAGKSTLFKLLARDFAPSTGQILIDGQPIESYSEKALFTGITLVEQEIDIFSDTLKNNLLIAKPKASDNELTTLLQKVELDYLIENKDKLDIWLGKGGRELSGGEKRRIGIIRALLHPSPILLLDEPTESLDSTLGEKMMALLLKYAQDKTLLYITHHEVGLDKMDKIYSI